MSVASGSCLPCVEGRHDGCLHESVWFGRCPCADRAHAPAGPDAPWTDADLDALERDYGRGGHDDVLALIRGVRAVLRLHQKRGCGCGADHHTIRTVPYCDGPDCASCGRVWPCPTVRSLNHPEESP